MTDLLPPALENFKLPVEEQLEALVPWLQHGAAAAPIDAYLHTFLEMQLRTARPKLAHEAALKAAHGFTSLLPRGLLGADEIEAEPFAFRQAIEIALRIAGLHAQTRRELLRPLFRSLLLWATYEREIAMQALQAAQPTDDEIATELPKVMAELPRVKERPGDRLLTVIEAGFYEPRWIVALCRALQTQPAGVAALMQLEFAILPAPADLYPAPWADDSAQLFALRAAQDLAAPLPRALIQLTLAAVPDALPDTALLALLDEDRLPAWLREEAADWLILRNSKAPILGPLADRLLAQGVRYSFEEKLQLLKQRAAPCRVREPVRSKKICFIPVDSRIASGPALLDGSAVFLLVRTLQSFPRSDWRCAEEVAELGVLNTRGELRLFPLPLTLASHRTGAAGAEREWALPCVLDGSLVISLRVPFSDDRGWGTETHLITWNEPRGFVALERTPDGITSQPIATPVHDHELPSWGFGELLVWKDEAGQLQSYNDGTPYHLDGVDPTDEVIRMRKIAERAGRGFTPLITPSSSSKKDRGLILRGDRKTVRLHALEELLRELDIAATDPPWILGGVALPDGAIAVGLRVYDPAQLSSPLNAVALLFRS